MDEIRNLTVRMPDGCEQSFAGRFAWALAALISAGEKGCTPIDHPGPRDVLRSAVEVVSVLEFRDAA